MTDIFKNLVQMLEKQIEGKIDKRVEERVALIERGIPKLQKHYYSIKEVAFATGITVDALKGRRKRGTVEFVNEGNAILMHHTELDRLLETLHVQRLKKAS